MSQNRSLEFLSVMLLSDGLPVMSGGLGDTGFVK